jgi:pimeloyl-ACP methyl ester carboxylesterase
MESKAQHPTIVLVHGAFEDASIWTGVIALLQNKGFPVLAFGNPLLGVAVDTAYLRSMLNKIDGPIVLAAHSYGGAVITQAGAEDPKVKALVYAAAIMPAAAEAAVNLLERYPGSTFPTSVEPVNYTLPDGTSGTYLLYQKDKFRSNVAADVPENDATLMFITQRPMNLAALNEKVTAAGWETKPSWQIRTLQDLAIPVDEQKFEADRAHAHVLEVDSSHSVTVSHPDVVATAIEQAARFISNN